jgi:uncharacterized membrane protein HdeD (DUF308 family)
MQAVQGAHPGQARWLVALRGIVAILFGIVALIWPGISLIILVYLFGAYVLANGLLALFSLFRGRQLVSAWWAVLIEGLVGIAAGILVFAWPHITILVMLMLIASWAIILGVFEVAAAFSSERTAGERWMAGIAGALSIVFGILLFRRPLPGLLTLIWLFGFYAIVWGITLIAHSMQQRRALPLSQVG